MSDKTKHQRRRYRAEYLLAKMAAFNGLIDSGGDNAKDGRRAKKKASEVWTRRGATNTNGMHKPTPPRPVIITRGAV